MTFDQETNLFYSVFNLPLLVYIILFDVYCRSDCFLLKASLLPASSALCAAGPGRRCALRPPGGASAGAARKGRRSPPGAHRAGGEWPPPCSGSAAAMGRESRWGSGAAASPARGPRRARGSGVAARGGGREGTKRGAAFPGGGRAEAARHGPGLAGSGLPGLTSTDPAAPAAPPALTGFFQNVIIAHVEGLAWFRCFCSCLLYLWTTYILRSPSNVKTWLGL